MTSMMLVAATMWGIAAPKPKEAGKKDTETPTIVGSWEIQKMTVAGMEFPAKALVFEFTADGKLIKHDPRRPEPGESAYKLDEAKTPAQIDWILEGKKEKPIRGIYRIDGDTLTICFEDGFNSAQSIRLLPAGESNLSGRTLSRTSKKK
jgi:uncharacterized protein (TIGR03067 family)